MKKLIFTILSLLILFSAASCRKKVPPSPPTMRTELVLDIFDSMKRSDHKAVIAKIERLKAIEPTNAFLSEFEGIERANLMLHEAEYALMRNDRKRAEEAIREAVHQIGNVPNVIKASEDISNISEMERLAARIAAPANSAALQNDIAEFRKYAAKFKNRKTLLAFADYHKRRIPILKNREQKITLYSLEADMLSFLKYSPEILDSMDAQRMIEQKTFR